MRYTKIICLVTLFFSQMMYSFADRGLRKKSKNKVSLNVSTKNGNFNNSLNLNLKSGLKPIGFNFQKSSSIDSKEVLSKGVKSYQKGNTIYLVPKKPKFILPDFKQGYTGMKIILNTKD